MRIFYKIFIESSLTLSIRNNNGDWNDESTYETALIPWSVEEFETEEDALKEIENYFNQPRYPYQPKNDNDHLTILKMYGKSKE